MARIMLGVREACKQDMVSTSQRIWSLLGKTVKVNVHLGFFATIPFFKKNYF